jgi:hypothetical protein
VNCQQCADSRASGPTVGRSKKMENCEHKIICKQTKHVVCLCLNQLIEKARVSAKLEYIYLVEDDGNLRDRDTTYEIGNLDSGTIARFNSLIGSMAVYNECIESRIKSLLLKSDDPLDYIYSEIDALKVAKDYWYIKKISYEDFRSDFEILLMEKSFPNEDDLEAAEEQYDGDTNIVLGLGYIPNEILIRSSEAVCIHWSELIEQRIVAAKIYEGKIPE